MKLQLKKYWLALSCVHTHSEHELENANLIYNEVILKRSTHLDALDSEILIKLSNIVLNWYKKAKQNWYEEAKRNYNIKNLQSIIEDLQKKLNIEYRTALHDHSYYIDTFLKCVDRLQLSEDEKDNLLINILNTNRKTIDLIDEFKEKASSKTKPLIQKIQEEHNIVTSLEDIEMYTFKITRQTHNAPDICFENQTKPIKTGNFVKCGYAGKDEYETISVRELLISQIKNTKKEISGLMQRPNLQNELTPEAWNRLKKNQAYLDVLEEAYSKSNYDEFLKFIKTTYTKDGFTIQIANDEDKSKRSKELKLMHFYGLAVAALSRVNKFYQDIQHAPLELKMLDSNLEETPFYDTIEKAKTDPDYKITNISETIRQLEELYEASIFSKIPERIISATTGKRNISETIRQLEELYEASIFSKIPERIISATTGKRQTYQGPKQYFKKSLLPESMLEKEDSQDSNTSNKPLARTQSNNTINTENNNPSQINKSQSNTSKEKGWSTTKKVTVAAIAITSVVAAAGIAYYLIKKNKTSKI